MECGYPGLGVDRSSENCVIKLKSGAGGRKKKKKISYIFQFTQQGGRGYCVSREDGDEAWRGKFTSDLNIKYKMAIAHHVMLTIEYASGVQKEV